MTPLAFAPPRETTGTGSDSALRVVVVHPDLLGTYGDGGNGRVLANRAAWRDLEVELVEAAFGGSMPKCGDLYLLGGGEDAPQTHSAQLLQDGSLRAAADNGAVVFAVCAGFQILGETFPDASGRLVPGVGLLDVTTEKGTGARAVGEVLTTSSSDSPIGAQVLNGFENHAGVTRLGSDVRPLGQVLVGHGNGLGGVDGAYSGRVIGTYLHGPVLARNPALCDALIALVTGRNLVPLSDEEEQALYNERVHAAKRPSWRGGSAKNLAKR